MEITSVKLGREKKMHRAVCTRSNSRAICLSTFVYSTFGLWWLLRSL